MLMESGGSGWLIRGYGRLGYRGTYHHWQGGGGEYEYPDERGRFDDDEVLVRHVVLHLRWSGSGAWWSWDMRGADSMEGWEEWCPRFHGWTTGTPIFGE